MFIYALKPEEDTAAHHLHIEDCSVRQHDIVVGVELAHQRPRGRSAAVEENAARLRESRRLIFGSVVEHPC